MNNAGADTRDHIGQTHATGVVKVQGEFDATALREGRCPNALDLCRIGHAGGVAEADAVEAHLDISLRESQYPLFRYNTFKRTAEGGGDSTVDADTCVFGDLHHQPEIGKRLFTSAIDVGAIMRFRRRHHHVDFVDPALRLMANDRAFHTLQVGHQYAVSDALYTADIGQHVDGIGHVRHHFRMHERGHFNFGDAGVRQGIDQRDLGFGRNEISLYLESIANRDIIDVNSLLHQIIPRTFRSACARAS